MKKIISIIIICLSTNANAQQQQQACNACLDSVSVYEGSMAQTQEGYPAGSLNRDFEFPQGQNPSSVQCSPPTYNGSGQCVWTCSDGTSGSWQTQQTSCFGK